MAQARKHRNALAVKDGEPRRVMASEVPGLVAQCRFCLEDAPLSELLAPCRCVGTGQFVHPACLREWQRQVGNDDRASTCQSCRAPFSLPPVLVRRPSRRECQPIFQTVTTNPHFDRAAAGKLPRELRRQLVLLLSPGCLILRHPLAPQPIIRGEDWNCGAYVIGAACPDQGLSQSDALIAVNVIGTPTLQSDPLLQDEDLRILQTELGPTGLSHVRGGPVQPRRALVLVAFEGAPSGPLPAHVKRIAQPAAAAAAAAGGAPRCNGALFGEAAHVLAVLRVEPGLRALRATAFWGHAVWSSQQLLSEVAHGHWGLTRVVDDDLMMDEVRSFEERRCIWQQLWVVREPLAATTCRLSGGSGAGTARSSPSPASRGGAVAAARAAALRAASCVLS
uniref:RING-CH-type domain-containing protein n=1 Tax=Alexandrium monilatum TaxID=311494 RepID=A0A7S4S5J9_9DINO